MKKCFASDNYSGFSGEIIEKVIEANEGYVLGYGEDEYTKKVENSFKKLFDYDLDVFLVFNGTGANIYSLEILNRPATAVITTDIAHVYTMETGALAKTTGIQIIPTKSKNGKLDLNEVKKLITNVGDVHYPQPKIISLTQTTENGSVYSLDELIEISNFCKENDIYLQIDGARFSNALVSMKIEPKDFIKSVKPDVLVFGGTKNGLMFGEAVLVFNKDLVKDAYFLRKQQLQLASKMRFLSAQFLPYIENNLWYKNAKNANDMAKYFCEELKKINIYIVNSVDANIIFAKLPEFIIGPLDEFSHFYVWNKQDCICRFITSFDTEKKDVDEFINKIKELSGEN